MMKAACGMNRILFDKKPFIVKAWIKNMSYDKQDLSIPVWVRFPTLDVSYWGESSLRKI